MHIIFSILLAALMQGGQSTVIRRGATLPSVCSPGDFFIKDGAGPYWCSAANTWTVGAQSAGVCDASGIAGADAGEKIEACIAALPSTGGTVDARGLEGDNTVTTGTITIGTSTKPVQVLLPAGRIISTAHPVFQVEGGSWLIGTGMGSPSGAGGSGIVNNGTGNDAIWLLGSYGGLQNLYVSAGPAAHGGILLSAAINSDSILNNSIENVALRGPTSIAGSKGIYLIGKNASGLVSFNKFSNVRLFDWAEAIVLDTTSTVGPTNNTFIDVGINGTNVTDSLTGIHVITGDVNSFYDVYSSIVATGVLLDGGTKNSFYGLDMEANTLDANITSGASYTFFQVKHSENDAFTDAGIGTVILSANASIVNKISQAVRIGDGGGIGVPAGLPATIGTNLFIAGGFAGAVSGKIYIGDGSGYTMQIAKRSASVDTSLASFDDGGGLTIVGGATPGLTVGASGSKMIQARKYTVSLTGGTAPASVNANSTSEQTFTVSGLTTADIVFVGSSPTPTNGTMLGPARASSADTLALQWVNATSGSLSPATGNYIIWAIRN